MYWWSHFQWKESYHSNEGEDYRAWLEIENRRPKPISDQEKLISEMSFETQENLLQETPKMERKFPPTNE